MKVLLSIKPEFVKKILSGEKKYEYRRIIFKDKSVKTIVIYSTLPVGKVVGEIEIDNIINENVNLLWEKTKTYSGISHEYFQSYFNGKENGYAISFKNVTTYEKPMSLSEISKDMHAPQSFCYIN